MAAHMVFAYIKGGTIKNIVVAGNYELANQQAKTIYGPDAFAAECTQYACSIGDTYKDGKYYFKDKETEIVRENTPEEAAAEAKAAAEATAADLAYLSMLSGIEL